MIRKQTANPNSVRGSDNELDFAVQILLDLVLHFNPQMHTIFCKSFCLKWVLGDPVVFT